MLLTPNTLTRILGNYAVVGYTAESVIVKLSSVVKGSFLVALAEIELTIQLIQGSPNQTQFLQSQQRLPLIHLHGLGVPSEALLPQLMDSLLQRAQHNLL